MIQVPHVTPFITMGKRNAHRVKAMRLAMFSPCNLGSYQKCPHDEGRFHHRLEDFSMAAVQKKTWDSHGDFTSPTSSSAEKSPTSPWQPKSPVPMTFKKIRFSWSCLKSVPKRHTSSPTRFALSAVCFRRISGVILMRSFSQKISLTFWSTLLGNTPIKKTRTLESTYWPFCSAMCCKNWSETFIWIKTSYYTPNKIVLSWRHGRRCLNFPTKFQSDPFQVFRELLAEQKRSKDQSPFFRNQAWKMAIPAPSKWPFVSPNGGHVFTPEKVTLKKHPSLGHEWKNLVIESWWVFRYFLWSNFVSFAFPKSFLARGLLALALATVARPWAQEESGSWWFLHDFTLVRSWMNESIYILYIHTHTHICMQNISQTIQIDMYKKKKYIYIYIAKICPPKML